MRYKMGENTPKPHNVVPILTRKLLRNEQFTVYGSKYDTDDGTAVRDYIHIDDLVDAHELCLNRLDELTTLFGIEFFNIGSGVGSSINDVLRQMNRVVKISPLQIRYEPNRPGDVAVLVSSIEKAKTVLGFVPKLSLFDICRSAYDYDKVQYEKSQRSIHEKSHSC